MYQKTRPLKFIHEEHIALKKGRQLRTVMALKIIYQKTWPLKSIYEEHIALQKGRQLRTVKRRGGGLGSRPKKMYGERLGDGVELHLMKPTPRR